MRTISDFRTNAKLSIIFLLLLYRSLQANGPEIGFDAGNIVPMESQNIQLVREVVIAQIPFEGLEPRVYCEYTLCNISDQDVTFTMGFVTGPSNEDQLQQYHDANIRVSQGRIHLAVSFAPVDRAKWQQLGISVPDSMPIWEISIPAHDTTALTITYKGAWSGGGEGGRRSMAFGYHALTARLWSGPIEYARITFVLGGLNANLLRCRASENSGVKVAINPSGYEWYSYGLKWEFSNWEPTENFQFMMHWYEGEE